MDRSQRWHAQGCTDDDVDIYGRCPNCRSVYSNMHPQRYPKLFGVPSKEAVSTDVEPAYEDPSQSLLPSNDRIRDVMSNRLEVISNEEIPNDPMLSESALILQYNECVRVDIGKSKAFLVCRECK